MEFKNPEVQREYNAKIAQIRQLINASVVDSNFLWDNVVKNYATKISQVQCVLNSEVMGKEKDADSELLEGTLSDFLTRCSSPEYQIALVGTIKAGKSTLINAILNYELASTHVTPETASLTKFKSADKNFVQISFYTDAEWAKLWESATSVNNGVFVKDYNELNADSVRGKYLNQDVITVICSDRKALKSEIARWTSSKSPLHYFVKEVLVGLKDFDIPEDVILVDTPGLNDAVEFRSDITRRYIRRANAVLMCIKADNITGAELQALYRVFDNTLGKRDKVYVIATQIDAPNDPVENWKSQREEWTKYLAEANCYGSEELTNKNLVAVAAYLYTTLEAYRTGELDSEKRKVLRAFLAKMDIEMEELDARFEEIKKFANIQFLYSKLQREVMLNAKEEEIDDIRRSYKDCQENINKVMSDKQREQEKIISDSQLSIEEIRHERDKKVEELKQLKQDRLELADFVQQLKLVTSKRTEGVIEAIRNAK